MTRRRTRRMLTIILIAIAVTYMLAALVMLAVQDSLIFPRHYAGTPTQERPPEPWMEAVWMNRADGARVEGWFLPAPGSESEPAPAVIFAHGNAMLIDHCLPVAKLYLDAGVSVLLPEFRGYGLSEGTPSQKGITSDMVAFHDWLRARPEVGDQPIIGHGRSLGGGVIAQLADQRDLDGLIIESSFTSIVAMARGYLMPPFICRHPFRTDHVLRDLDTPVLIMHGNEDSIIPIRHGRKLHEIARDSRFVEFDADHNDFPRDWARYADTLGAFLDDVVASSSDD